MQKRWNGSLLWLWALKRLMLIWSQGKGNKDQSNSMCWVHCYVVVMGPKSIVVANYEYSHTVHSRGTAISLFLKYKNLVLKPLIYISFISYLISTLETFVHISYCIRSVELKISITYFFFFHIFDDLIIMESICLLKVLLSSSIRLDHDESFF